MIEVMTDMSLTDQYWDCLCDENYIHSAKSDSECPSCGAHWDTSPNSRVEEVLNNIPGVSLESLSEREAAK